SRALLRQALEADAIRCDYREPGHVHLALDEGQQNASARTVAALRADGFAAELLDRQQAQALIDTPLGPDIVSGLFAPEDGLLNPAQLVGGRAGAARRRGARICWATTVIGLADDDGSVLIATTRGRLRAGAAIVATNAWSGQVIPALADLITPVRGQVLCYA